MFDTLRYLCDWKYCWLLALLLDLPLCPLCFWSQVTMCIFSALGPPNMLHSQNFLLGILPRNRLFPIMPKDYCIHLKRKTILLKYNFVGTWKKLINASVLLYIPTYELRKKLQVFDKIWFQWVSSPHTLLPPDPVFWEIYAEQLF